MKIFAKDVRMLQLNAIKQHLIFYWFKDALAMHICRYGT